MRNLLTSLLLAFVVGGVAFAAPDASGKPAAKLPSWDQVELAIAGYFDGKPKYTNGDLISRGDLDALVAKLEKLGWKFAPSEKLKQKLLADSSFMVRELRTAQGVKFMRQIGRGPLGYDRFDRLTWQPSGEQTARALIKTKDGFRVIDTLGSGANKGAAAPQGWTHNADFNKPTGRIYTAEQLTSALKEQHAQAVELQRRPADRRTTKAS